jgi:hypothetical protein
MKLILIILILACIILFIRLYLSMPVKVLTLFNQSEPFDAASCSNYQVFNSNENICETVSPENYPLAPIQTMVLKTRGSPGKMNFKECTSLTSGDCVLLYNNNGIMQTAFPCSGQTPIYDFNTNMCTPEYDTCCSVIPSLKTYSSNLNSCKKRMELDSVNSTTTSNCLFKNSNSASSKGKKCCGNSANAGRSMCSNYWRPAYKWKLNQSPPIAGSSCPSIQTGLPLNSPFTDYAEYNQMNSNVIMVPEEKIVFLEDVKQIFENANNLNSPKNM